MEAGVLAAQPSPDHYVNIGLSAHVAAPGLHTAALAQ